MTTTNHRANAERQLARGTAESIAEAHVHATLALVDALRQHDTTEPDGAEQAAAEQLTSEQIANRQDLAGLLRIARKDAETVHPGQYGRSLGVLLGFLAHLVEDPAQPLGFMPRHAAHVADHLAEQAQRAPEAVTA
ncbi:hypothetical protein AB0L13_16730 [Saccharopolyspora shandongensis]|uniref:hypothetical protein n=1 Tax=Saccharopolyspora shandongensis TaxID=418495 RepID=UPI00343BD04C